MEFPGRIRSEHVQETSQKNEGSSPLYKRDHKVLLYYGGRASDSQKVNTP